MPVVPNTTATHQSNHIETTLNKQQQVVNEDEGPSSIQSKKKPLPKIPLNNNTPEHTFTAASSSGYSVVGPAWTSSSTTNTMMGQQQFIISNNNEMISIADSSVAYLTESSSSVINNHQQCIHHQSNSFDNYQPQQGYHYRHYVDPYYAYRQSGGHFQQSSYYQYDSSMIHDMSTISLGGGEEWKTSATVKRSKSLKIKTATHPVPFTKGGQLPLETYLEKPFDPSLSNVELYRKASKEEIQDSILLQKLNNNSTYNIMDSTDSSSSGLSTPSSCSLNQIIMPPQEEDQSVSASERYSQQPNNISPISSRIPSPWGTAASRRQFMERASIHRIYTGSIPKAAVQTVPDEIINTPPPLVSSSEPIFKISERYFNVHNDEEVSTIKRSGTTKLSIASCSLINIRSNTKLYRRMAVKTRDKETQMTYAKYLLQISKLYEKKNSMITTTLTTTRTKKKKKEQEESPAETRHRLLSEAGYWIEKLSKSGNPEALYIKARWHLLGPQAQDCVLQGYGKVQESKAFKCFLQASKAGWVDAYYELAHLYKKRGQFSKAIQWYEKGAKENHTLSIYKMAKILLRGQLKKQKDIKKGLMYLKQAADMNDGASAEPAFVLGCIYANEFDRIGIQRNSTIIEKDHHAGKVNYSLALQYLKKSAHHSYPDAIYFMGQVSETGMLGQLCDAWQAYQYYMKAAEVNHVGAMLDLSRIYSQGISGLLAAQQDLAFKWCKRSADLGFDQAEYVLGKYYEDGIGVTSDFALALEYFGKAASKRYQPAAEKLNRPLVEGTGKKKNLTTTNPYSKKYLAKVVSDPKVKQDDDDDIQQQKNYTPHHSSSTGGQSNNNNVCNIQ